MAAAPDPARNYHEALKRHHESTGLWFIHGAKFSEWMEKGDLFLWIHGIRESLPPPRISTTEFIA
jgi:hypothetical protein